MDDSIALRHNSDSDIWSEPVVRMLLALKHPESATEAADRLSDRFLFSGSGSSTSPLRRHIWLNRFFKKDIVAFVEA